MAIQKKEKISKDYVGQKREKCQLWYHSFSTYTAVVTSFLKLNGNLNVKTQEVKCDPGAQNQS